MKILGVEIDNLSRADILTQVERFLAEPKFHQIATVNPEFLVEADRNSEFRRVLSECDLRVADGFGISLVAFFRGVKWKCRFPGVDLMEEVLKMANEKNLSVFLAVRADGLSSYDEVRSVVSQQYPRIKIGGGNFEGSNWKLVTGNFGGASQLPITDYGLLICNFGAPHQELFLAGLKAQDTKIRLALGIGGAFDYLTGKRSRAPKWLCAIGLEWLWRFASQPKRWRRIWNATGIFLFKVVKSAIRSRRHS
jgi:N-acetylglucosaminyldiphosphoundecaprenol N-acetyl-beta-D-mannosaminyltransferase